MGATVLLLDGTAAKTALLLSLPVAALLFWRRRLVARIAAALTVVAVLTAPLTLPSSGRSSAACCGDADRSRIRSGTGC